MQIVGAEGMTPDELREELEQGARVVVFTWVVSLVVITITQRSAPYLVRPVEGMLGLRLRYAFASMLCGWWGVPWGLIRTPIAIFESLSGGEDFTHRVLGGLREERSALAAAAAASADPPAPEHDPAEAAAAELDRLVETGDLAGARRLLEQTRTPGSSFGRERLRRVAERLHREGEHEGALAAFAALFSVMPGYRSLGNVAALVRASERALGRTTSLVPPQSFWSTKAGAAAFFGLLALAGLGAQLAWNMYLRANASLQIVNGTGQPLDLEVEGAGRPQHLEPGRTVKLSLAEGDHLARVTRPDGRREAVTLELRASSYLRRFLAPSFVWNVDGAGAILREQFVYARSPRAGSATPGPLSVQFGEQVLTFESIEYFFTAPPAQVTLSSRTQEKRVDCVRLLTGTPSEVVAQFPAEVPPGRVLEYLELRLGLCPDDPQTVNDYVERARGDLARARTFLAAGLARRPVVSVWHRAWQDLRRSLGEEQAMIDEYRALQSAAPDDATLLALLARSLSDRREADGYLARALELDPECAQAWLSRAWSLSVKADWAAASEAVKRAVRLAPADARAQELARDVAIASGDVSHLVDALEAEAQVHPTDVALWLRLAEALIMAERAEGLSRTTMRLTSALAAYDDPRARAAAAWAEFQACYLTGRLGDLDAAAGAILDADFARFPRFVAALVARRHDEAASTVGTDPLEHLELAVAHDVAGDPERAAAARGRAAELLASSPGAARAAAALLRSERAPDVSEVERLDLSRDYQAALLLALVGAHPEAAGPLIGAAERRLTGARFPYPFLRQMANQLGRR